MFSCVCVYLCAQIAPFNVDFAVTDIDLDFTHMREHVRRIMVGESSIFALGANNAVVKMLGTGGPRVLTYQVSAGACMAHTHTHTHTYTHTERERALVLGTGRPRVLTYQVG